MPDGMDSAATKVSPRRIIGYVAGSTPVLPSAAKKLTHINYAFAHVSDGNEVILHDPEAPENIARLRALKAVNPDLKIIVSVGGWGADGFSDSALTDASRKEFANSVVEFVQKHDLDGIDLDWEYPGQPGPGIKYRPEDKENFTLWLAAMRQELDVLSDAQGRQGSDRFTVTIASADREYFDTTEMDKLHVHLDWINIMAYDFFGSLTPVTGHHAGLGRSPHAPPTARYGEASVQQHLAVGIPPEKLVLGVPFYGRGWTEVNPANNGRYQTYGRYFGDFAYANLAQDFIDCNGYVRYWDDQVHVPYLWNAETSTFISYEDPESLSVKANFIMENQLGGFMYWEHSHDPDQVLLDTLYQNLNPTNG